MPWYLPATGLAGGLLLTFALVEWRLDRWDPDREGSRRRVFLAAGGACIIGVLLLYAGWQHQVRSALAQRLQAATQVSQPLLAFEAQLAPALARIEQLLAGPSLDTLAEIRAARLELLDSRRSLAVTTLDPAISALELQTDTLLGVAYHATGAQWSLAKQGRLTPEEHGKSVAHLANELERWKTLRACIAQGSTSCAKPKALTDQQKVLAEFNRWMHLYSVELLRFSEHDLDLVDSSPAERKRLASVLARGRNELSQRAAEEWSRPVTQAAEKLLRAAEEALQHETVLISQGQWGPDWQQRAYRPVQLAMEGYFVALSCTAGRNLVPCDGPSRQRLN